jgi:hypothetical protein
MNFLLKQEVHQALQATARIEDTRRRPFTR